MSGGTYDRNFRNIEQLADDIECRTMKTQTSEHPTRALRLRFVEHLRLVAKAAHDIEWVDSDDYGPGDEVAAIEAVLDGKR